MDDVETEGAWIYSVAKSCGSDFNHSKQDSEWHSHPLTLLYIGDSEGTTYTVQCSDELYATDFRELREN